MDLVVSIFTNIYCCLLNPHYHYILYLFCFLMQPSGGGKQNEEVGLWFHQWTMQQAGIKKEQESQPQPARSTLLATLACACACAPPTAVSRNK